MITIIRQEGEKAFINEVTNLEKNGIFPIWKTFKITQLTGMSCIYTVVATNKAQN